MANPVIRGFRNLMRFSGRDSRGQFWPYVGVVFALTFVLNGAGMAWMMSDLFADVAAYAETNPDTTVVTSTPGSYSIQYEGDAPAGMPMPDMRIFSGVMAVTVLIAVSLLAAAVSRRLHDRNIPAWWGLAPLPFLAFGLFGMNQLFGAVMEGNEPDFSLFGLIFMNNVLYMAVLVTLVIIMAQQGTVGPNRYGEEGQA